MSDAIKEAQELFNESKDCLAEQREQIRQDLLFSDPSNPQQWDETIKSQRETDPGGARPCLVFDQVQQYISNVSGQILQRPPALHALPVDGGADKRVAEQLDGFFRHIEHVSRAQQHYCRAQLSAARAGVGYLIVRPDYVNRALNWQEPRIGSEGDPLKVVFDPWSVELDGSDANFGFLLAPMSPLEFKRRYGEKAEQRSFGDDGSAKHDPRESVITAEMWRIVTQSKKMLVVFDGENEAAMTEDDYAIAVQQGKPLQYIRDYTEKANVVKWCRMSGAEMLDKETEYPASGIGIVPVYGYVGESDSRMTYCGMARRAMNPQRSYNYHMSEMHVFMGQAPKSPWVVPMRAIKGLEALWDRASVDSRAYLPYHDQDELGAIQQPNRTPLGANLQNHIAGAQQALSDIQAALGMYQANLGAPSNETSGVAIDNRKEQGEASTANFPANLQASIGQVGKLCMEMIPRLIDTPRQLRILGIDMTPGNVQIDPKQEDAIQETEQGLSINPNVGRYDVRVVVGSSFSTQRSQAQTAFSEMMRSNPEMTPALAPLWAGTVDMPNADKLQQVLTAVAPPEVRAVLAPESDKQPKIADLVAENEQLKAKLEEAMAIAQEAEQDGAEAEAKLAAKDEENEVRRYEAETNRLKVTGANEEQIKAIVADLMNQMLTSPQPLGDEAMQEPPQGGELQQQGVPVGEATEMPPEGDEAFFLGQGDSETL